MGRPKAEAAAFISVAATPRLGLNRPTSAAKRMAPGTMSYNSASRFAPSSMAMAVTPVTLPPGRLRLATRPTWTGSLPMPKTIGIVGVADLAARAANTLGAIAGIVLSVQFLLPQFGLQNLLTIGVMIDIGLGILILQKASVGDSTWRWMGITTVFLVVRSRLSTVAIGN